MVACCWNSKPCSQFCSIFSIIATVILFIIGSLAKSQHEYIPDVGLTDSCAGATACAEHKSRDDCPSDCTWETAVAKAQNAGMQCMLAACLYICMFVASTYFWVHVHNVPWGGAAQMEDLKRAETETELTKALLPGNTGEALSLDDAENSSLHVNESKYGSTAVRRRSPEASLN
jgi:hypothetical protein